MLQQSYFLIAAQAYFRLALCPDITEEFQFLRVIAVDGVETKIILVFYRHGSNCSSRVTGAGAPGNVFYKIFTGVRLLFRANPLLLCAKVLPDDANELRPAGALTFRR